LTISEAFLQGVTYKELAEATGEPLPEVNFVLPVYRVAVLRTLPGYEDFDPITEVFHCEKPGTGCNDAPRCFSLKLAQVTRTMCGLKPSTVDGELCMKHVVEAGRPKLVAIMTKHVDDLKLAGIVREIILILQQIEKFFGKLKIEWHEFTNCGVRHRQRKVTKESSLDQMEYASSHRIIAHLDLMSKKAEDAVCAELHSLY
jgi:hypothetical protein